MSCGGRFSGGERSGAEGRGRGGVGGERREREGERERWGEREWEERGRGKGSRRERTSEEATAKRNRDSEEARRMPMRRVLCPWVRVGLQRTDKGGDTERCGSPVALGANAARAWRDRAHPCRSTAMCSIPKIEG